MLANFDTTVLQRPAPEASETPAVEATKKFDRKDKYKKVNTKKRVMRPAEYVPAPPLENYEVSEFVDQAQAENPEN